MDRSPYETERFASADESLLVSPLLADFFTRDTNAYDEQRLTGKNLQRDIEDATTIETTNSHCRKSLLDGMNCPQLSITKNEEQTKDNFMNALSSSPIERGDNISPNAANLLQLDTSFCPSLGFGSVGSSSEEECDNKTDDKTETSDHASAILLSENSDHASAIHLSGDGHNSQSNPDIHPLFSDVPLPLLVIDQFLDDHPTENSVSLHKAEDDRSEPDLYLSETSTIENNDEETGLSLLTESRDDKGSGIIIDISASMNRDVESISNGMHRYQDSIRTLKVCKEEQSNIAEEIVSSSYCDDDLEAESDSQNKENGEIACSSEQNHRGRTPENAGTIPYDSQRHSLHYFGSNFSANLSSHMDNSNHQKLEGQETYTSVASLSVDASCTKCSPLNKDQKLGRQHHITSERLLDYVDETPNVSNFENSSSDSTQYHTQSFRYNEPYASRRISDTSPSNRSVAKVVESITETSTAKEGGIDVIQEIDHRNVTDCRSDSDRSGFPDAKLRIDATSSLEVWRSAAHRRKLKVVGSQQFKGAEPRLSSLKFAQFEPTPKVQPKQSNVETRKLKTFAPEEDPYRPFKAKSLPKTLAGGATGVPKVEKRPITEPKSPRLGLRRKPGNVKLTEEDTNYKRLQTQQWRVTDFSTHPPLKRTIPSVSRKALEAEPFIGVLSGKEVRVVSFLLMVCFFSDCVAYEALPYPVRMIIP